MAADLVVVDSLPGDVGTVSSSVVGVVTGDSVVVGRAVVAGRGRVVDGGGTDVVAIAGVTGGWGRDGPGAMATTSVLVVDDVAGAPDGSVGFNDRYAASSMATRTTARISADRAHQRVGQCGTTSGAYQPRSANFTSSLSISSPFMGSPSPRLTLARIWASV